MENKTQEDSVEIRKIVHPIRFTNSQYEQLKSKANLARVSVTEFIRRASLRKHVVEPPPPPQLNWKLYEELGAIGNNLNQIAKGLNSAKKAGLPVNVDVEKTTEIIAQLTALTNEVQMQLLGCGVNTVGIRDEEIGLYIEGEEIGEESEEDDEIIDEEKVVS
jgi:hypothetical protein